MIQALKRIEERFSLSKAAIIVGMASLLSRLVGLVRDRLFASHFGAGDTLDIYYAAFRIPDFVFNLLVLGTLSVAFIPVFTELLMQDRERAYKNANTILNFSFLVMTGLCLFLIVFAGPLTKLLVPGFVGQKFESTVVLTRIFLISPIIFTLSNVFSSILNAQKKFLVVGFAPILYNLAIIFGLLLLYPKLGITGLGLGVLLGAALHFLVQVPEAVRSGFSWQPILDLKDKALHKIAKLFVPRIFGLDNSQISLIIGSMVGSILASGSIAIFNLANNLQAVPLGVFAISYAIAAFPLLSEHYAKKDERGFANTLSETLVQMLFFIIPISILLLLFRAHVVRLVFGAGKFNWQDTILTFNTLGVFSFSLFGQALTPLLARAFYARQNTVIPVGVSLLSMALNAILAYRFGLAYGIVGVAAAFSIASVLNALALFFIMRYQLARTDKDNSGKDHIQAFDHKIISSLFKIILASCFMGAAGYGTLYAVAPLVDTHTGPGLLIQAALAAVVALLVFLVFAAYLSLPQAKKLLSFLKYARTKPN